MISIRAVQFPRNLELHFTAVLTQTELVLSENPAWLALEGNSALLHPAMRRFLLQDTAAADSEVVLPGRDPSECITASWVTVSSVPDLAG